MPAVRSVIAIPLNRIESTVDIAWHTTEHWNVESGVTTSDLRSRLKDNFNQLVANVGLLDMWSSLLSFELATIKLYTLDVSSNTTGSPFFTGLLGLTASPGSQDNGSQPGEVRLCLSYHGDLTGLEVDLEVPPPGPLGNVHEQARRHGRHYIGPFNGAADIATGRAPDALCEAIRDWGDYKMDLSNFETPSGDVMWRQYSPTEGAMHEVVGGWVDNAWDTQKKGGLPGSGYESFGETDGPSLEAQ